MKQKEVNQFSLLPKTLESLSHWKNEQFSCSVFAFFTRNFGFSVFIGSLNCTFLPCPPTSLNSLTSAVDHLEFIHRNGLKIFSCALVFGSGQLAAQLLPCIRLLFSPAQIGISQLWHTNQSMLFLLPTKRYILLTQYVEGLCSNKKSYPKMNYLFFVHIGFLIWSFQTLEFWPL